MKRTGVTDEGEPSGINRNYRLYRADGLTVRERKAVGTRVDGADRTARQAGDDRVGEPRQKA